MPDPVAPIPFAPLPPGSEQVLVPMADGVRLAADVYLPDGPAPPRGWPTVLVRLPYDKSAPFASMPVLARHANARGYAFVAQDVRGKVRSEGETLAFVHEVRDGHATLDWIAAQPFSDGAVGMFGDSYYGFTQWAAAASGHPALRAIVPRMTSTEIGTDWMCSQGVFNLFTMVEWAGGTWLGNELWSGLPDWSIRPLAELVPGTFGRRSRSLDAWLRTPPDDPFWVEGIYGGPLPSARPRVPVLHSAGLWDVFAKGQLRDFARAAGSGAPGQHLRLGALDHFDNEHVPGGGPQPDPWADDAAVVAVLPRYLDPGLDFLDRVLRGLPGPALPPVRWQHVHMGWQEAPTWPPPGARPLVLALAGAARAADGPEGGALAAAPDAGRAVATWTHDPADPVPSAVEDAWHVLGDLPDERAVERRPDVLTFTAEAADAPLDLAGPVRAVLRVGSSAPSMHVICRLCLVDPDGASRRIVEGAARVGTADGEAVVDVDLGPAGIRVLPGQRLRLVVASSDFPRYLLHPGTAEDPWTATRTERSAQRLVTGGADHSRLELTVVPGGVR